MEICLKSKIIFKKVKKLRLFLTYINIKCKKQGIMEMDLTIDQSKLVTENHNLIYGILKEYVLLHKEDDISDWYGIAAEGLVSAATTYNKEVSNFSTHAYKVMSNRLKNEMKANSRQKQIPVSCMISLYSTIPGTQNITYLDGLEDNTDVANYICTKMRIQEISTELTDLQRKVISYLSNGYLPRDIVSMGICSKANVYKIIDMVRKKYNTY